MGDQTINHFGPKLLTPFQKLTPFENIQILKDSNIIIFGWCTGTPLDEVVHPSQLLLFNQIMAICYFLQQTLNQSEIKGVHHLVVNNRDRKQ